MAKIILENILTRSAKFIELYCLPPVNFLLHDFEYEIRFDNGHAVHGNAAEKAKDKINPGASITIQVPEYAMSFSGIIRIQSEHSPAIHDGTFYVSLSDINFKIIGTVYRPAHESNNLMTNVIG